MNPEGVHVNFASDPIYTLHFDKHQKKNKFTAYIYSHFNQNHDKKSYINAKIEAVKHLHAVFLQAAEQRRIRIRLHCHGLL